MPTFTRLFRGAFGVGGMFSRPPLFSQKRFPHQSTGALGHFVPKSRLKGGIMPKYYEISEGRYAAGDVLSDDGEIMMFPVFMIFFTMRSSKE